MTEPGVGQRARFLYQQLDTLSALHLTAEEYQHLKARAMKCTLPYFQVMPTKLAIDLEYAQQATFWRDITLILRTVLAR